MDKVILVTGLIVFVLVLIWIFSPSKNRKTDENVDVEVDNERRNSPGRRLKDWVDALMRGEKTKEEFIDWVNENYKRK